MSVILSLATIWVSAYLIEDGDVNAMSMYFVVFLIPCIFLVGFNGVVIGFAIHKMTRIRSKRLMAMIPIVFSGILVLASEIEIPYFDGAVSFVGIIGLISLGITNLIWAFKLKG